MRAGLVTGKERFELVERPDPSPAEGEVVVAITRCGVCGSDVHAYQEGWPYSPGVCGHEWVGQVVDVGPGVEPTLAAVGRRVVGGRAPGCGACPECRAGIGDHCRVAGSEYSGKRAPSSGGFAPFFTLSARRLTEVPDDLSDDDAALVEPASVALHAVRRSALTVGDVACIVGCGPIGLMALQCARVGGAGTIIAVEPDEDRRRLALALGADTAVAPGPELRQIVNDATGGLRADIAFDCAGIPQTLQQSVDMVRQGGSVCLVGVSGGEGIINPMRWMMKEVTVVTSLASTLDDLDTCARLLANGRISSQGFVERTTDLDGLPGIVDDLANRRISPVKVLVDPTAG
ncbi:MAG: zinc-binding dehydrogenase [Actinomycetota bacterium]